MVKKIITVMILAVAVLFAACGGGGVNGTAADLYNNTDHPQAWDIDALGEIIVAAGMFWSEWWDIRGRFGSEHLGDWEDVPDHLFGGYQALLPTSGFASLNDIWEYLLQLYPLIQVDAQLTRNPFIEYDNTLYILVPRHSSSHPNWETATHTLIEQYGCHATVESIVIHWSPEDGEYFEFVHRFTFIDGLISSKSICPICRGWYCDVFK